MRCSLALAGGIILAALIACKKENGPETPEPVMVPVEEVLNLTPGFIGYVDGVKAGDNLEAGDSLTLELLAGETLSNGFYRDIMEHIHIHVGDTVYVPEFPATSAEYVPSLSIKVAVPDKAFGIVAAYAVQQQMTPDGYTMRLEENSDGVRLYGVSPEHKYKYFDCYLRTPDAYTIESVEFRAGEGEWQDVNTVKGCRFERTDELDWVYKVTIRPDYQNVTGDVTLRVKGSQHGRYHIKWLNTDYIRTDIPDGWEPNILPEESIDGENVTAQFYTREGYYLADASSNVKGLELECISRSYIRFTMPASDVEISMNFRKKATVSYAGGTNISTAALYDAPDIYYGVPTEDGIPGEAVYLFANADKGYKPSKAYVKGSDKAFDFVIYGGGRDKYQYYAEVVLPEGDGPFEVNADAVKAYTVSGATEGVFMFENGTTWAPGEIVSFTVYVPSGKTLAGVTAKGSDGRDVVCTLDNVSGSFVMPDCDVTLTAAYTDVNPDVTAHISAIYDADEYRVFSQTNPYYQSITADGFDVPAGTALYISISDDYGNPFWVGVKIGDSVSYFKADIDPDFGDASFGKTFTFTADAVIKVGATEASVKFEESSEVSVSAVFNADDFIVRSSTDFNWNFAKGFKVSRGSSFYLTVQNMYGDKFWVGVKVGDQFTAYEAVEDEETGEFTFGKSIKADGDVLIKVGYSSASVTSRSQSHLSK